MKRISLILVSVLLAFVMCSLSACALLDKLFDDTKTALNGIQEIIPKETVSLKKLTCIDEKTAMAFSTDKSHAVFVHNEFSFDEKETVLYLVDLENDEIVNECSFKSDEYLRVICDNAASGYIFLDDACNGKVYRVTSDLESVKELENVACGGYAACEGTVYIYCEYGEIVMYSIEDKTKTYIETELPIHVVSTDSFCSSSGELAVSVYVGLDSYVECKAVANIYSGKLSLLTADYEKITPFEESYMTVGNLGGENAYICIDKADDENSYGVKISKLKDGKEVTSAPELYMVSDGELLLLDFGNDGVSSFCLYKSEESFTAPFVSYLEESTSYAFCVDGGEGCETFVCTLFPEALPELFDGYSRVTNIEFISDYFTDIMESDFAEKEVSEQYSELREYADEIEYRYDVEILIADQCLLDDDALPYSTDFELSSSCFEDEDEEIDAIRSYLEVIDSTLGEFPNGFFSQFRTSSGHGGVKMLLTGTINTYDRDIVSVGVSWSTFKRYYSAFDITQTNDMHDTVCHELFHCIDYRLTWYDSTWNYEWSKLNPDHFIYGGDYNDYLEVSEYNYEYPNDDWYFIDTYCYVNIKEDMARVFEYATSEFPDYTSDFFESEHITEKLAFIDCKIRDFFYVDETSSPAFWTTFLTNED